jgi:hypothetical protein
MDLFVRAVTDRYESVLHSSESIELCTRQNARKRKERAKLFFGALLLRDAKPLCTTKETQSQEPQQ